MFPTCSLFQLLIISFIINDVFSTFPSSESLYYYGDISIEEYVAQFCTIPYSNQVKSNIFIIDNLYGDYINKSNHKFSKIKCEWNLFQFSSKSNLTELANHIRSEPNLRFKRIQVIVDLMKPESVFDQLLFNSTLENLSNFLLKCLYCRPIIVLFNLPLWKIHQWTKPLFEQFPRRFQSIFISKIDQQKGSTPLFVRPVINGCQRFDGLFLPQTKSEFDQLKMPYQNCNLNGRVMNTSIVTVHVCCSLISLCIFVLINFLPLISSKGISLLRCNQTFEWNVGTTILSRSRIVGCVESKVKLYRSFE